MKTFDFKPLMTAATVLALIGAAPAVAQVAGETSSFETPYGMGYGQADRPYEARGLRDANGNLAIVNGRIQTSASSSLSIGLNSEWGQTDGFTGYGSGQAIGNQLNVITQGNYNTVIVDSTQINNGNQSAILNGELNLDD